MAAARDIWVRAALAAAFGLIVYFLAAAFATKFGLIDWRVGFGQLTMRIGPLAIIGVLGFAALGLLLALLVPPRRGRRIALIAVLIPLIGLGFGVQAMRQARSVPPIHDISTDLADPPAFTDAVVAARAAMGANDLDLLAKRVPDNPRFGPAAGQLSTELQRAAYPDLQPIRLPADSAFDRARDAAGRLGWRVTTVDPSGGIIEAEVESFWFGFKDDIVIRVRETAPGEAVIDVRSVSRVGVSDLGANARRIRAFQALLAEGTKPAAGG